MKVRVLAGLIMAGIVICILEFLPPIAIKLIVILLAMVGCWELLRLMVPKVGVVGLLYGVLSTGFLSSAIIFHLQSFFLSLPLFFVASFGLFMMKRGELLQRVHQLAISVFAILFCSLFFAFWGILLDQWNYKFWAYAMLAITFAADTGGFVGGKLCGKHKMAPTISPGKSWEGYVGGIILGIVAAVVCHSVFDPDFSLSMMILLGVLISTIGPMGDLCESFLKRGFGVKDIGSWIPGHGGLMDRVDALLFAGPIIFYFMLYLQR